MEHLWDDGLILCDVRWYLGKPGAGVQAYHRSHLPGAVFVDLDRDLSGPLSRLSGRHPWPGALAAAEVMERLGITRNSGVVCYDDAGGSVAARMWLVLKWLGHGRVAVLDGALQAWKARGYPLTSAPTRGRPRSRFLPHPRGYLLVDKEEAARISRREAPGFLADARAEGRYRGEVEPVDARAGHIPGAANLPFSENLQDARFASPEKLRERFEKALPADTPFVSYCGSGVTACHNLLAREAAGLPAGRLYAGSWSEWARDDRLEAVKGANTYIGNGPNFMVKSVAE